MVTTRRRKPGVRVKCEKCGNECSTESKNVARQVKGWVPNRAQGGPNQIRFSVNTGRYAHIACLDELYRPAQAGQGELF